MDMQILYALEKLRAPVFDALLGAVTHLGDETFFMLVAITVYWCVSKKWGYYLLLTGYLSTLINQAVKILCRVPRPWVRDPGFSIVENARAAAAGYSFPSGHTAGITVISGCLFRVTKRGWLRAVCVAALILVAFSRMYLGVHYPSDVLFSLVVGLALVFAAWPVFRGCDQNIAPVWWFAGVLTALCLAFALFTGVHAFPADTDPENLSSAAKNAWTLTGSSLGALAALWIERRYVNFDTKAVWWAQICKVAIGLALLLGIRLGLKPLLAAVFGDAPFTNAIRYFCMVLFGAAVWPMSFRRFGRLGMKK